MQRGSHCDQRIQKYICETGVRTTPAQKKLIEHTMQMKECAPLCGTQDTAQLLQWLIRLTHSKRILEVGCLTGVTTVALALATPQDGRVVTIDRTDRHLQQCREWWKEAGVEQRVTKLFEQSLKPE